MHLLSHIKCFLLRVVFSFQKLRLLIWWTTQSSTQKHCNKKNSFAWSINLITNIRNANIRNLKKVELKNNLIGKVFCSWRQSCFLLIIILITSWLDIFPFMLITIILITTEYNLWLQGLDFIFTLTEIKQATPLLSSHQKVVNKCFQEWKLLHW